MTNAPTTTPIQPSKKRQIITARRQIMISMTATVLVWAAFHYLAKILPPVTTPTWAIWLHVIIILPAVPLGAWVLWARKGTKAHKLAGRTWAILMLITAIDSYWLRTVLGGLGPIHLLSALTLVSIPMGVYYIRRGDVAAHVRSMRGNYIGLCLAGAAAFIPGRFLGALIFG